MIFTPEPITVAAEMPPACYWWLVAAAACLAVIGTMVANELPPYLDRRARRKRFRTRAEQAEARTTFQRIAVGVVEPGGAILPARTPKEKCDPPSRRTSHELARPGKRRASAFFDFDGV